MEARFEVRFLEEAKSFLIELPEKAREKVIYNITKAKFSEDKSLFKKLSDEIWEFRSLYNKTHYRIFAFWHKLDESKSIVIATHGIKKKSRKISHFEIERAKRLKNLYQNK